MTQDYFPSLALLARLHSPSWQDLLRQTVYLYLALEAEPAAAPELDIQLHNLEQQLLDYLLAGEPVVLAARQLAQVFLDMAQHELLFSKMAGWDLAELPLNSSLLSGTAKSMGNCWLATSTSHASCLVHCWSPNQHLRGAIVVAKVSDQLAAS